MAEAYSSKLIASLTPHVSFVGKGLKFGTGLANILVGTALGMGDWVFGFMISLAGLGSGTFVNHINERKLKKQINQYIGKTVSPTEASRMFHSRPLVKKYADEWVSSLQKY